MIVMKTTGIWHIDRFPWHRGDVYIYWWKGIHSAMNTTAMRNYTTPEIGTWYWSHRPLSNGLRTQP